MEGSAAFTRLQQQRSRDTLIRIVASAVGLFSPNGFDATRVSDVAREASVPVGTVYKHFADKEALLAAIVARYRACRMREISDCAPLPKPARPACASLSSCISISCSALSVRMRACFA